MKNIDIGSIVSSINYKIDVATKVDIRYADGEKIICKFFPGHFTKVDYLYDGSYVTYENISFVSKLGSILKFKDGNKYIGLNKDNIIYIYNTSCPNYNYSDDNITIDEIEDPSENNPYKGIARIENFKIKILESEWTQDEETQLYTIRKELKEFSIISGVYTDDNKKMLTFYSILDDNTVEITSDEPFTGYIKGFELGKKVEA